MDYATILSNFTMYDWDLYCECVNQLSSNDKYGKVGMILIGTFLENGGSIEVWDYRADDKAHGVLPYRKDHFNLKALIYTVTGADFQKAMEDKKAQEYLEDLYNGNGDQEAHADYILQLAVFGEIVYV